MANPTQRDDIHGTAASADDRYYRDKRAGNLTRQSDGLRTPYVLAQPRGYVQRGYKPDEPLAPYRPNPASPAGEKFPAIPRTWKFFRAPDLGAPRVGLPDAVRTHGKLEQSGEAWGRFGERRRPVLNPAGDSANAPPTHELGSSRDSEFLPRSMGPRWERPSSPRIYDHLPH